MQASCYGFNPSKFLMLKLCSSNNNTLQKSGVLDVNNILGIGSRGIKGVARHVVLNHLVVDPIFIAVILSDIPFLKLEAKVDQRFDKSGMRSLLFSLGCSLFSTTLCSSRLEVSFLLCQTWSTAENTVGKQTNYVTYVTINFFCLVRKIQVQPTVIWVMPAKKCLVLICTKKYHKNQELPVKGVLKNRLKMEINVLVLLLSKFLALQKINKNQQYKQYTINLCSLWSSLIGVTFCQISLISVINCCFQRWKTYVFSLLISVFLFLVFSLYLAKKLLSFVF